MSCRTLIVEDDAASARALVALVNMLGHEVTLAASVAEAMAKLEEFNPECVLLDLELPDGSGVAVLPGVRAKRQPVKVAIISALEIVRLPFEAITPLAPDVVFQKPLSIDRVHDWLSAHA